MHHCIWYICNYCICQSALVSENMQIFYFSLFIFGILWSKISSLNVTDTRTKSKHIKVNNGRLKKEVIFIPLGSDPPPSLESDKNIFYFVDTRPFFENFLKKRFFAPRKAEKT